MVRLPTRREIERQMLEAILATKARYGLHQCSAEEYALTLVTFSNYLKNSRGQTGPAKCSDIDAPKVAEASG